MINLNNPVSSELTDIVVKNLLTKMGSLVGSTKNLRNNTHSVHSSRESGCPAAIMLGLQSPVSPEESNEKQGWRDVWGGHGGVYLFTKVSKMGASEQRAT